MYTCLLIYTPGRVPPLRPRAHTDDFLDFAKTAGFGFRDYDQLVSYQAHWGRERQVRKGGLYLLVLRAVYFPSGARCVCPASKTDKSWNTATALHLQYAGGSSYLYKRTNTLHNLRSDANRRVGTVHGLAGPPWHAGQHRWSMGALSTMH